VNALIWITGIPCTGKSTLAEALTADLDATILDDKRMRHEFWPHLGQADTDWACDTLALGMFASVILGLGRDVIVASVSPIRDMRQKVRETVTFAGHRWLEVAVRCEMDEIKRRDRSGLYATLPNFFWGAPNKEDGALELDSTTLAPIFMAALIRKEMRCES